MRRYIIDDGEIFDGTLEQFKDCFFDNADDASIENWCDEQGYKLEIEDPNTIIILEDPHEETGPIAAFTRKGYKRFKKIFPDDDISYVEMDIDSEGFDLHIPKNRNIYEIHMNPQGKLYKLKKLPRSYYNSRTACKSYIRKGMVKDEYFTFLWASSEGNAIDITKKRIKELPQCPICKKLILSYHTQTVDQNGKEIYHSECIQKNYSTCSHTATGMKDGKPVY